MLFLLGRRYPYLGAVVGGVLFVTGVALNSVSFEATGAVVLAVWAVRSIAAWRHGGLAGGKAGRRSLP